MDIGKLFNGIAVMIDDEINKDGTQISTIRKIIESKNIPIVPYDDIPQLEIIPALSSSSFIILDWDYTKGVISQDSDERIMAADTLGETQENALIDFINELMKKVFVPVFIFTFTNPDNVKDKLRTARLWQDDRPNRIFIKQKNEISTEVELFGAIEEWLKVMPSVYVLKEWEQVISATKSKMFLEMYGYSPYWTKIIWDMLKDDSRENHREFGDFVTRNLINRIEGYIFDESILDIEQTILPEELSKVVEGERYITYEIQPQQVYTGDLFLIDSIYYLNVRAQCDLAREQNPLLYLIKGKELGDGDIVTEDIRLTSERELHISAEKRFSLERLGEICQNEEQLIELNSFFRKHRNNVFYSGGDIIGKKSEIVVTCIAGKKVIKFRLDLLVKKYNEIKDKRIGRVLPPFITRIQQNCSQYIIREGIMPTPKEVFTALNE